MSSLTWLAAGECEVDEYVGGLRRVKVTPGPERSERGSLVPIQKLSLFLVPRASSTPSDAAA
jgi:hypothetical protein